MKTRKFDKLLEIADQTPPSRDRMMDFLRVLSICVVVLGHWFMAAVSLHNGQLVVDNTIAHVRHLWIATWLFQVMPLFFFVGGFANYTGLVSNEKRGGNFGDFLVGRIRRLLQPVATFLLITYGITVVLVLVGVPHSTLRPMAKLATQLLWFIGVYLLVVLFSGMTYSAHKRFGIRVIYAGVAMAIFIDVLRFNTGLGVLGYLNVPFVWLTVHQFGYLYAEGTLTKVSRKLWLGGLVFSYGLLIALTTWGPYPHSMVGMPNEKISNMNPPSICILILGIAQICIVMLLKPRLNHWLARRNVWAGVIYLNLVIMTVFLWHLPSLMATVLILLRLGVPQPAIGSAQWWWLRLMWVTVPLIPLFGFITIFSRFERIRAESREFRSHVGIATVAAVILILGVLGFAVSGLYGIGPRETGKLVFVEVGPLLNGIHVLIGLALLSVASSEVKAKPRTTYLIVATLAALGLSGVFATENRHNNVFALSLSTAIVHGVLLAILMAVLWRRRGAGAPEADETLEIARQN